MDIPQANGARPTTQLDYAGIAVGKPFQDLLAVKQMFIVPALIFFLLNFIGFAVLVGYAPQLASTKVIGTLNIAYLFGLLQFVLGWTIAGLYLTASAKFDRLTKDVLVQIDSSQHGAPRGGQ